MVYRFLFVSIAACLFVLLALDENDNLDRREKINIVLLTVADLRYDLMNNENSPRLLETATTGFHFVNFRTTSGKTGPTIFSLLTGLPSIIPNLSNSEQSVDGPSTALPLEQFQQNGYRVEGLQPFMAIDFYRNLGLSVSETGVDPRLWLAERRDRQEPFFLWYHYGPALLPYEFTNNRPVSMNYSRQAENIRAFDHWFGKFWSFFTHGGCQRDTILLVTTSHNGKQEVRGLTNDTFTSPAGQLHSEAEPAVLFVWLPEKYRKKLSHIQTDGVCSSMDIMPTLLALLGIKPAVPLKGKNIFYSEKKR